MRYLYVGIVPILATALLVYLFLVPSDQIEVSRARIAGASVLSLAFCGFTVWAVGLLGVALHAMISPRPFMTHYVTLLIVEPQDNSFPCFEMMLAAYMAVALYAVRPLAGRIGFGAVLLLGVDRIYCGSNYIQDVVVGGLLGASFMLLSLAIWRVPVKLPGREAATAGQARFQGIAAAAALFFTVASTYGFMAADSRFAAKLRPSFGTPAATPIANAGESGPTHAASAALEEGEGVPGTTVNVSEAETEALTKRSQAFLPEVEKQLKWELTPVALPYRLLDVEVSPVKAGNSEYRAAALRFAIFQNAANSRHLVAEVSKRLVIAAFLADPRLQNVDIAAVTYGDGKVIDNMDLTFAGGEVPVFTASIQRENLYLNSPADANAPDLDPGRWLHLRSLLFISDYALPAQTAPAPTSAPVPTPTPTATLAPKPTAIPAALPKPTAVPLPTATPRPTIAPKPTAPPAPTPVPTAAAVQPTPTHLGLPPVPVPVTGSSPVHNVPPAPSAAQAAAQAAAAQATAQRWAAARWAAAQAQALRLARIDAWRRKVALREAAQRRLAASRLAAKREAWHRAAAARWAAQAAAPRAAGATSAAPNTPSPAMSAPSLSPPPRIETRPAQSPAAGGPAPVGESKP